MAIVCHVSSVADLSADLLEVADLGEWTRGIIVKGGLTRLVSTGWRGTEAG